MAMRYLALLCAAYAADVCSNTQAIDGQPFPDWIKSGGATRQLTGGGTRYKYGVAKVYAVGLYVAESALGAGGTLAKWVGGDPKALAKDASFRNSLTKMQFPKVLLLQFHRAVDGPTVAKALNDALAKKLGADVLAAFKEALERVAQGVRVADFVPQPHELRLGSPEAHLVRDLALGLVAVRRLDGPRDDVEALGAHVAAQISRWSCVVHPPWSSSTPRTPA